MFESSADLYPDLQNCLRRKVDRWLNLRRVVLCNTSLSISRHVPQTFGGCKRGHFTQETKFSFFCLPVEGPTKQVRKYFRKYESTKVPSKVLSKVLPEVSMCTVRQRRVTYVYVEYSTCRQSTLIMMSCCTRSVCMKIPSYFLCVQLYTYTYSTDCISGSKVLSYVEGTQLHTMILS